MRDLVMTSEILNLARSMELRTIGQYMQHHYFLSNANIPALAEAVKQVAIKEMRHAEMLAERIREIGLLVPTYIPDGTEGKDVIAPYDVFLADTLLEEETLQRYQEYVSKLALADSVSEQLLKKIMVEEEGHYQYFGDVRDHLQDPLYLAKQMGARYTVTEYEHFIVGKGE